MSTQPSDRTVCHQPLRSNPLRHALGKSVWPILMLAFAANASADTLRTIDRGWYRGEGLHIPNNQNYITGSYPVNGGPSWDYRSFFVFDLSAYHPGDVVDSAVLQLENPIGGMGPPGCGPLELSIFSVESNLQSLMDGTAGVAAYSDLGDGRVLGSTVVDGYVSGGGIVEVTLNDNGLAALNNARGGQIAFGGAITMHSPGNAYYVFSMTNASNYTGISMHVVPEPSALALLGFGCVSSLAFAWRRRKTILATLCAFAAIVLAAGAATADTFGTGANQFTIDFVPISGTTNPTSAIPAGDGFTFVGVNHDYRMGVYEITNAQWDKFKAACGTPAGSPSYAYSHDSSHAGADMPTDCVSWYEAAQFVNWLNTSTNHQAAYKFTGTQGTSDYTFAAWNATDAGYDAANPFRNTNAFYFLPSENEWVKAAYWNGAALQPYATQLGQTLMQGSGTGWNYYDNKFATNPYGPWNVGSGSQELNGTYDMMGNDFEWTESPWTNGDYGASSPRGTRGGYWGSGSTSGLAASYRGNYYPSDDYTVFGFRVACVPEPSTFLLLGMGGIGLIAWGWRRKQAVRLIVLIVAASAAGVGIS
jgi:formylglycine-generating enzyme required for sulfatase activity